MARMAAELEDLVDDDGNTGETPFQSEALGGDPRRRRLKEKLRDEPLAVAGASWYGRGIEPLPRGLNPPVTLRMRVLVLGYGGSGKTSLIQRAISLQQEDGTTLPHVAHVEDDFIAGILESRNGGDIGAGEAGMNAARGGGMNTAGTTGHQGGQQENGNDNGRGWGKRAGCRRNMIFDSSFLGGLDGWEHRWMRCVAAWLPLGGCVVPENDVNVKR